MATAWRLTQPFEEDPVTMTKAGGLPGRAAGEMPGAARGEPPAPAGDVVVAIDGPAGSGKSTVARSVAARAGLRYLDTGSTYRAITLALLRRGTPLDDPEAMAAAAGEVAVTLELDQAPGGSSRVLLDGEPLGPELRSREVNAAVSAVSAVPAVRRRLVDLQRSVMAGGGVVAEGRDIGTVVSPEAEVKVFLTASATERARRRGVADGAQTAETAAEVARRDHLDANRAASPTRASDDAVVIDSTDRPVSQVVEGIVALIEAARARRAR